MRVLVALVTSAVILAVGATGARADALQDGIVAWAKGDYASAVRLLSPLAEQGNRSAQNIVGGAYADGFGVPKDCQKGLGLVSDAASAGYARAQYMMGRFFSSGTCTTKDNAVALAWFRKSARQHDPDAEFMMGYFYSVGRSVNANLLEAYKWYYLCVEDWNKTPSLSPVNMRAAKNNLDQLNKMLSQSDLKQAKALIAQSN